MNFVADEVFFADLFMFLGILLTVISIDFKNIKTIGLFKRYSAIVGIIALIISVAIRLSGK
ncbi:hypothetical protein [Undibacterium oligocarboniphilum]|uniref:Uncharacterized protein n=1 Tax=Undibacterium oligocarboniphilum TaxID=666702 RepID=A0A850QGU0_9BURK|nr:hypothetical protein [Undibacterium oligocarboniphilum]MBC3870793.1 hypothetical protein [Undibacterium oligocarboniphilum]NVO76583.1 hypothetical protein [Undibacterium oligocarboniphilum]